MSLRKDSKQSFESGSRKAIPAVLIYAKYENQYLMLYRNGSQDFHLGKWNGLGGKCELDESFLDAAAREFKEESGLTIQSDRFRPLGMIQFPNFKPHRSEDWIVSVFSVQLEKNEIPQITYQCDEGELKWIETSKLMSLPMWEGDQHFLPRVIENRPFLGTIWYVDGEVKKHAFQNYGV